jgi:hypothetical protein
MFLSWFMIRDSWFVICDSWFMIRDLAVKLKKLRTNALSFRDASVLSFWRSGISARHQQPHVTETFWTPDAISHSVKLSRSSSTHSLVWPKSRWDEILRYGQWNANFFCKSSQIVFLSLDNHQSLRFYEWIRPNWRTFEFGTEFTSIRKNIDQRIFTVFIILPNNRNCNCTKQIYG